jgi:Mg-chelatase subunit ChlI
MVSLLDIREMSLFRLGSGLVHLGRFSPWATTQHEHDDHGHKDKDHHHEHKEKKDKTEKKDKKDKKEQHGEGEKKDKKEKEKERAVTSVGFTSEKVISFVVGF